MFETEILDLFKVMVIDTNPYLNMPNTSSIAHGYVTDFTPSTVQKAILDNYFKSNSIVTLFSVKERKNSSIEELLNKQLLNYIETYGLGIPGLFNLEVEKGKVHSFGFVKGVSVKELKEMVLDLIYSNIPLKDAEVIKKIINYYNIEYDINRVLNNEIKVAIFNPNEDLFKNGDDAVRYICYLATKSTLLIKSREVITAIKKIGINNIFFDNHAFVLSQVFHRHKNIILAAKNDNNKTIINAIGRMAKKNHVPIKPSISKSIISHYLKGDVYNYKDILETVRTTDLFKYLNLILFKMSKPKQNLYVIRNGKVFYNNVSHTTANIDRLEVLKELILSILKDRLKHLNNKKILLDKNVHYGLPISRKQTIGHLPYGTKVSVEDKKISSGIYWELGYNAYDLDLSTIDKDGNRTGWGQLSGYSNDNPVTYSGDMAYPTDKGAMEFMTSKTKSDLVYGLYVNVFNGSIPCNFDLVVGNSKGNKWIDETIIKEKHTLLSKGNIIGFVKNGSYIVFYGRGSNKSVSDPKDKALVERGLADFYNINMLLDILGISYSLDREDGIVYDHDLIYSAFTFDKLEEMVI